MNNFTQITDTMTLLESRQPIMDNFMTALTQSSGTAFPTTEIYKGRPVFRSDENRLYVCTNETLPAWGLMFDFNTGRAPDSDRLGGLPATSYQRVDASAAKTNLPVGWYTIAVNKGNRAIARFGLKDINSSDHQSCIFYASHHYGAHSELTVLHSGRYIGSPFRYIRIKEGGTYDGAALQVYIDDETNKVQALILGENFQDSGWIVKDFIPDSIDPGNVANFAALTSVAARIDLDNILDGGIATTGEAYVGGSTVQNKVWHSGNFNPESKLGATAKAVDSDKVDGLQASQFVRSDADDTKTGSLTINGSELFVEDDSASGARLRVVADSSRIYFQSYAKDNTGVAKEFVFSGYGGGDIGPFYVKSGGGYKTIWHSGNQGSGSGLDADTVDGIQASSFLRSNAHDTASGIITFSKGLILANLERDQNDNAGSLIYDANFNAGTSYGTDERAPNIAFPTNGGGLAIRGEDGWAGVLDTRNVQWGTINFGGLKVQGNEVWHTGNMGSGSGLNADLLDGLNSTNFARLGTTGQPTNYLHINLNSANAVLYVNQLGSGPIATFFTGAGTSSTSGTNQVTITNSAEVNTTGNFRGQHLALTNGEASILFDGDPGEGFNDNTGTALKRITCNDGGGNFNIWSGGYYNGGNKYVKAGGGAAKITMRSDSADGSIELLAATKGVNANDPISFGNSLKLTPSSLTYGGNKVWHAGNDGSGSGLDADLLDGLNSTEFIRNSYANGYDGIRGPNSGASNWIRTTTNGFIPYQSGGASALGTSSWPFNSIYGVTIYEGGTALASKYLGIGAKAADSNLLDGIDSGGFLRSNANDTFTGQLSVGRTSARHAGIYGIYDSYKTGHIWSMGTAYKIDANGANFGNLYGLAYKHTNNATGGTMGGGHQMVWCANGVPKCSLGDNIWTSGNVTAYSDIRVKTNIEPISDPLEKVMKIGGYTFDRTDVKYDDYGNPTTPIRQTGVIAQEVIKVLPEAVTGGPTESDPDGHYSVAYGNMVGLLIEAIKELKTEVDELKRRIE